MVTHMVTVMLLTKVLCNFVDFVSSYAKHVGMLNYKIVAWMYSEKSEFKWLRIFAWKYKRFNKYNKNSDNSTMSIFLFLSDSILKRKKIHDLRWSKTLVSPTTIHDSSFTQDIVRVVEG